MSNNMLTQHLKEVADAIRAKKGTSDLINPQDFATEIEGISGSGGGESGVEYVVQTLPSSSSQVNSLWMRANLVKIKFGTYVIIDCPISIYNMFTEGGMEFNTSYIEAMCIDFKAKVVYPDGDFTIEEGLGVDKDFFAPITKEQFYDLNA